MRIPGRRIALTRVVRTDRYAVAVPVEAVVPDADPSDPCFEAETVKFLRDVHDRAVGGDEEWLRRHGKLYVADPA